MAGEGFLSEEMSSPEKGCWFDEILVVFICFSLSRSALQSSLLFLVQLLEF